MIDSTARAERFDPAPSTTPYYTWEVPQKPVVVRLPLPLIDRLESETVEAFRSVTSRGSEIGGVLWGGLEPGDPATVSIVEYDLVVCEYTLGPLYKLAEVDLARLDRALAQRGGSGLRAVGFFRSHTRKGLSLDPEDIALMDSRFKESYQVALVIRPYTTKPSAAGIFIREAGAIHGESSYLEFSFRSAMLAPAKAVDPVEAAPAPAKPSARAQIVPIASRRDMAPPVPTPVAHITPVLQATPAPQPVPAAPASTEAKPAQAAEASEGKPSTAAAAPPMAATSAPASSAPPAGESAAKAQTRAALEKPAKVQTEKPAKALVEKAQPEKAQIEKSQPEKAPAEKAPVDKAPVEKALAEKAPADKAPLDKSTAKAPEKNIKAVEEKPEKTFAPAFAAAAVAVEDSRAESAESGGRTGSHKLAWFAIGAIFPLLLSGFLFIYPGVLRHSSLPAGSTQDSSSLALRVERTGNELLLTWNRDSKVIQNASHAVLEISDGEQHENVDMDLTQLRNGSIVYLPMTADVVFRMEVSGKDKAKTASESVRVLRTRPSPLDDDKTAPPNGAAKPGTPTPAPNTPPANLAPSGPSGAQTPGNPSAAVPANGQPPVPGTAPGTPGATPQTAAPSNLKAFNTESLAQRLRPARPDAIALPDAPTVGRGDNVASANPALQFTAVDPVMPPAPRKADPPAPPAAPAAAKPQTLEPQGGNVVQAQLVTRKDPEYPRIAREAGAKGSVELIATIGANGRVKSVKAVKGHPLLQKAAIDAVMQWVYKPCMLNGHAVETQSTITLNFVSER